MSYIKTNGIIISEANTGEADKVVTIFTKSHGKIYAFAKNARKFRGSIGIAAQFLCYGEYILYKSRSAYTISSCEIIEPFYELRTDIEKLTYAAHMADVVNYVILEEQPSVRLLQLFLNTLYFLSKSRREPQLLCVIFELKLLSIIGYSPWIKSCISCEDSSTDNFSFSFKECGLLCPKCQEKDFAAWQILPDTVKALRYIVSSKIDNLFNFNVSPQVLNELVRISKRYLRERLDHEFTRLDFIKNL